MTMEKGEFIYWLDGFTSSKTKLNTDDTMQVKSMINKVFDRDVVIVSPLPCPPFNPDFAPVGTGL